MEIILELREPTGPLKNPLGHNGPYIGGTRDPVARDCDRVPDHSELFRSLESFERDLVTASTAVGSGFSSILDLQARHRPRDVLPAAMVWLESAGRYLRDAQLIAQVLDDREARRLRLIREGSISDLALTSMPDGELLALQVKLEKRSRETRRMLNTILGERRRRKAAQ